MIYKISIEPTDTTLGHYQEWVVESPGYRVTRESTYSSGGRLLLPRGLKQWVQERTREASVTWGFLEVQVEIGKYSPARIGYRKNNGHAVREILDEYKYLPYKPVQVSASMAPPSGDCTECGAVPGQAHAPYCAYNEDAVM